MIGLWLMRESDDARDLGGHLVTTFSRLVCYPCFLGVKLVICRRVFISVLPLRVVSFFLFSVLFMGLKLRCLLSSLVILHSAVLKVIWSCR